MKTKDKLFNFYDLLQAQAYEVIRGHKTNLLQASMLFRLQLKVFVSGCSKQKNKEDFYFHIATAVTDVTMSCRRDIYRLMMQQAPVRG